MRSVCVRAAFVRLSPPSAAPLTIPSLETHPRVSVECVYARGRFRTLFMIAIIPDRGPSYQGPGRR